MLDFRVGTSNNPDIKMKVQGLTVILLLHHRYHIFSTLIYIPRLPGYDEFTVTNVISCSCIEYSNVKICK